MKKLIITLIVLIAIAGLGSSVFYLLQTGTIITKATCESRVSDAATEANKQKTAIENELLQMQIAADKEENADAPKPTSAIQVESLHQGLLTISNKYMSSESPNTWTIKTDENTPNLFNIILQTPDFELEEDSARLKTGAEIEITSFTSTATSIEDAFNADKLAAKLALDKKDTKVGEIDAIQYDYQYEWDNITKVIFIRDGIEYSIAAKWADAKTKTKYLKQFQSTVESVELPNPHNET